MEYPKKTCCTNQTFAKKASVLAEIKLKFTLWFFSTLSFKRTLLIKYFFSADILAMWLLDTQGKHRQKHKYLKITSPAEDVSAEAKGLQGIIN